MSKVVKLSSVMEREEKLKEIYEGLEEIKDQLTAHPLWFPKHLQEHTELRSVPLPFLYVLED